MRMLAVLVAISILTVPFLMVPDVRAASGVIEISSPEELSAIGTGFPSNGHYRLTGDIVFPTAETMDVNVPLEDMMSQLSANRGVVKAEVLAG